MKEFNEMNKAVKEFFDHLDTMLENDTDIKVTSTEELVKEVDRLMEGQQ